MHFRTHFQLSAAANLWAHLNCNVIVALFHFVRYLNGWFFVEMRWVMGSIYIKCIWHIRWPNFSRNTYSPCPIWIWCLLNSIAFIHHWHIIANEILWFMWHRLQLFLLWFHTLTDSKKAFKPTWKAQFNCYVYIEITRTNEYKVKLNKFSV